MINKKILLSLFTIGLLACIASAGTWAYFQDTLDVNNTEITTANLSSQYALVQSPGTGDWTTFYGDTGNSIGPFNITNLIPSDTGTLQIIKVRNMGSTSASVTATITPTSLGEVADLQILVGNVPIYENGHFNSISSFSVPLSPVAANGANYTDTSISYVFEDNGHNQNSMEGQDIKFDMSIAVRATH
jgi:predicted ribosomally synthesized peptide with SipW-like signal peptide